MRERSRYTSEGNPGAKIKAAHAYVVPTVCWTLASDYMY